MDRLASVAVKPGPGLCPSEPCMKPLFTGSTYDTEKLLLGFFGSKMFTHSLVDGTTTMKEGSKRPSK